MTNDDAFMALAGVRYCLGRHSYAPSLCCGWLKGKWPEMAVNDRVQIVKEVAEHIVAVQEQRWGHSAPGWECDLRTWRSFYDWTQSEASRPPTPIPQNHGGNDDA